MFFDILSTFSTLVAARNNEEDVGVPCRHHLNSRYISEQQTLISSYRGLRVELDDNLDLTGSMEAMGRKGQSRLYFLRSLKLLHK